MAPVDPSRLVARCFEPAPARARWVQLDVALVREGGDARPSARVLFAHFAPWWDRGCAAGHACRWFFMRKPPDVRLRVLATPEAALDELIATLAAEVAKGRIANVARGEYAPEIERFGGAGAMALVHGLFTLDSACWYERDRLAAAGVAVPAAEAWLAAVFDDLFTAVGAADGWARLAHHVLLEAGTPLPPPFTPPSLAMLAASPLIDPGSRALAAAYRAGHAAFASRLGALDGLPADCPAAGVAANAAFFAFNRHGFPGERSRPLVAAVQAARNGPRA